MAKYKNKHGRKPGRGLRPWVLIPKVLCVGAVFGGFLAAGTLLHASDPQTAEQWQDLIRSMETLFLRLIVPAVFGVVIFGILLLWMHWRAFLGMRWVWTKLILLLIALPPLHLSGRWHLHHARAALTQGDLESVATLMGRFTITVDITILAVAFVIGFARHKPRLGQKPKTVKQQREAKEADA